MEGELISKLRFWNIKIYEDLLLFREYYLGITADEQANKEELLELGMGLVEYPWHPKNSPKLCQEAFFVANNWVDEGNGEGYPGEDCNEFEFTRS